jgi:glutamyl-tRNA reductase
MTVSPSHLPKALAALRSSDELQEAVVLSTCMRTEVYLVADRYHPAVGEVRHFLSELSFTPVEAFAEHLYDFYEDTAVAHLFRVAAGLDSAVIGESEILGQVRSAWEAATAEGAAGPGLGTLFRHALEVGKRARAETAIGRGTASVAQAAVQMAAQRLGSLEGRRILVLGAGDMGGGIAVALAGSPGVTEVMVANRTWASAVDLAARVGGRPVRLDELSQGLMEADVVLTATGAPSVLLDVGDVVPVLDARGNRELLVVDVSVPRDIDPAVGELDGVTLLDMDDLRAFADAGLAERRKEVGRVQALVSSEVERYGALSTARKLVPLVVALRDRAEEVRSAEVERYRSRLAGLDSEHRQAVEALTRSIVAKLLHQPTVQLKEAAGSARADRLADTLRALFDL